MFKLKDEMTPYLWYHICVAYVSNTNEIKMFVNGEKIMENHLKVLANMTTKGIKITNDMVLGSCRDLGSDDPHKTIARIRLQDFNMWSTFLADDEIMKITGSCINPSTREGKNITKPQLVSWKTLAILQQGSSALDQGISRKKNLCGNSMNETILMMPLMKNYERAIVACEHFGGKMVFLENEEMFQQLNASVPDSTVHGILNRFTNKRNTKEHEQMETPCNHKFWMPVLQNGEEIEPGKYSWLFDRDEHQRTAFLPWKIGQPNGLDLERCVVLNLIDGTYEDVPCSENHCTLCSFEDQQRFTIRGLQKIVTHKSNSRNLEKVVMDREYVFLPMTHRDPSLFTLNGYLYSDIRWTVEPNIWKITSSHNGKAVAYPNKNDENIAIGNYEWDLRFPKKSDNKIDISTFDVKITQVGLVILLLAFIEINKQIK
jgi:hypothetical protein